MIKHWAQAQFEDFLKHNTIMLCATESWAYDFNGMPYHKLWSGCGWSGPASDCPSREYAHGMFKTLTCPECSSEVWDKEQHERAMMALKLSVLPPIKPFKICPCCKEIIYE